MYDSERQVGTVCTMQGSLANAKTEIKTTYSIIYSYIIYLLTYVFTSHDLKRYWRNGHGFLLNFCLNTARFTIYHRTLSRPTHCHSPAVN